uniref:Uncharacterized protein n=1 Tax=Heterorhabditis bacteriophora TaxID=37862 RepID=A0A1I7X8Y6_HETBA
MSQSHKKENKEASTIVNQIIRTLTATMSAPNRNNCDTVKSETNARNPIVRVIRYHVNERESGPGGGASTIPPSPPIPGAPIPRPELTPIPPTPMPLPIPTPLPLPPKVHLVPLSNEFHL